MVNGTPTQRMRTPCDHRLMLPITGALPPGAGGGFVTIEQPVPGHFDGGELLCILDDEHLHEMGRVPDNRYFVYQAGRRLVLVERPADLAPEDMRAAAPTHYVGRVAGQVRLDQLLGASIT